MTHRRLQTYSASIGSQLYGVAKAPTRWSASQIRDLATLTYSLSTIVCLQLCPQPYSSADSLRIDGIATASDAPPGSSYKSSDDYSGESFLRCSTSDDGQHGDHSFLDFDHAPHKDDDRGTAKVLLLGRSGSGKSTFLKQLSLLYGAHEEQQSARRACQISIYLEIIQMLQYTLANSNDLHATALCRIRLAPVLSLQNQLEARLVETRLDERGSRSPPYGAFEIIPHIFSALKNEIQAAMESMSPLDKLRPVWAQ